MSWEDSRLNLTSLKFIAGRQGEDDYLPLPSYVIDFIWVPDPYVTNSKDAAITKLTTTYASVTLYRNHTIRYSARVYSIIACQMEFHEYPMDVQTCSMIMQSFMYSPEEVEFLWRPWSPVLINRDLKLLQFSLTKPLKNSINQSTSDELGAGNRPVRQLIVEFQFSREIGHHLVQTFVPSFLVVALSWFSFWLGLEAIPGRVTLLVTSLLTLTTLFTGIKEGLPPVAYVKAIDVWMAGCMVFVFAALGEFVVVRVLNVMHQQHIVHPTIPVQPAQSMHRTTTASPTNKHEQTAEYLRRYTTLSHSDTETNGNKILPEQSHKISDLAHGENGAVRRPPTRSALRSAWDLEQGGMQPLMGKQFMGRLSLHWVDVKTGEKKILWKEIDKASRIVFPLMFLLFMVIYFPILISRSF
ncbi:glycine receptor subunit alpha-3-like [Penaeus japonicus]|uniref:glycine receptor subunit alpha-3-like n=1 Tax=Penaeus japonicus TaxID=27405 RepID=UPI001C71137B|nr:glycine receptor subunit alpha-3-like [Penaeus japonicus]